ncbi:hypothetical protein D9M68_222890 [compost metagenome]
MRPALLCALALCLLAGCAHDPDAIPSLDQGPPDLPYRAWYLGLLAPDYMEVWVESVDVIDRRGLVYEHVTGGVVSVGTPPDNQGTPKDWPASPGGGKGKDLTGIDLPEIIFVRWQSLVEPQTYNVRINVPAWVRKAMVTKERPACPWAGDWAKDVTTGYRSFITIGLAPGGIAKVWLQGVCLEAIEIGRFEGVVSKLGPDQGQSGGQYAVPLEPESRAYIDTFGIPYGSW